MNIVRFRRLAIHVFFSITLLVAFTTPVYAITTDLSKISSSDTIPLNSDIPLITPSPIQEKNEQMGPFKPDNIELISQETNPTPTNTPKASSSPTPTPTKILQSTPTPTEKPVTPTAKPTQIIQSGSNSSNGGPASPNQGGLNADVLFELSNNYRVGKGLTPFQKDERVCSFAAARAPQIAAEISGGYMHAGQYSHNFPYWFAENIVTMRTETEAFNWWINHAPNNIHKQQIESNNTHSCVACSGNACVQHFTSFRPK